MNVDDDQSKENKNANNSNRRSSLKTDYSTAQKNVIWDWKSLEEQENDRILNPKKKINEPKTPYLPYEEGDDEYLSKLNEVNKTQPTMELLEQVASELKKEKQSSGMEVEVIDKDGNVIIEKKEDLNTDEEETSKLYL
jgi:hypothetical protein